jgi:hypothetical protein
MNRPSSIKTCGELRVLEGACSTSGNGRALQSSSAGLQVIKRDIEIEVHFLIGNGNGTVTLHLVVEACI